MSPSPVEPPLGGRLVVDLSTGIAGAYATKLLADGGAEVVKVETPEGDPLRRWSASGAVIPPEHDGALFGFLSCSKQSVVADPDLVRGLLEEADAVVWSAGPPVAERPELSPRALHRDHPRLVVTSITPFGLDGPWRDRAATEFTLQAWSGGIIGLGRGAPDRPPVFVGGRAGDWVSGAYAAAATMASLLRGGGELVDLSMLEAHIMSLTYHPVTFWEMLDRPWQQSRRLNMPGVAAAKDGLIALGCATAQQFFDLCAMVGHPEWIDEKNPFSIIGRATEVAPVIQEWIAGRTVAEIRELATAFRIPNSPVVSGANASTMDHFEARRAFLRNPRDGFLQPALPYRLEPARLRPPGPAPRLGEHTESRRTARRVSGGQQDGLSFSGLRVLDMTAFWAGPSCTHVLAMLGAEVIHLESTARPDGTRLIAGVPPDVDQWWERSPIFAGLNTNKKSLTLDIRTERGREVLRDLMATCDVIVENYTPRVLDQLGLGYEAIRAIRPDAVVVRMPGFGLDGPWRDNAAFAFVIEDASGLTWLTGHPDQNPVEPYSIGDPNAGVHALNGLLLALEHRRRTGEGVLVEAAMVDAALNVAAEQVIEYSAYGTLLERAGNRGPTAAPQNLYRTAERDEFGGTDSWVAIAVATDEQWDALRGALGRPAWAMSPDLATADGRRAHHDDIDERLASWCAERGADDIVDTLWPAGVPVGKVIQPHRQGELEQLGFRGFFEELEHPVGGRARYSTLPVRLSRGPDRRHTRPAPLLGEHNHELLAELGLTEREIAALEADGVIGRAPAR
ncbi:CaiB/BaiF CoA-transferase family protein [Streptomyces sp. NRRL B-3229]|uniref:CaiB/BaiF CoA-transferase family protein n=1 Tax=Streptomyces sp. NRRL B-3229 TaxID=1463836 RepID=UPI0004C22108|nr:CoA transferase [Streptomyces sp. NRRL B-3229]